MIVYIENFHMYDLFSENDERCKPLTLLHVSGVLNKLFLQLKKIKLFYENWIVWPFNSFRHFYNRRNGAEFIGFY